MKINKRIRVVLGWLVALAIIYLIFRQIDISQVIVTLRTASIGLLAVAVALMLAAHFLRVFKWYVVLRDRYDVLEVSVLFFSSRAFGDLSPARLGEFAPLLSGKYRSGKVAALMLVDRFFEIYATLFFGIIGVLLLRFHNFYIIAVGGVVLLAIPAILVLLANTRFWERVQEIFGRWSIVAKGLHVIVVISQEFRVFKRLSWLLWLISMIATFLNLFFFQMLFLSVGVQVSWSLAATMVFVAAITALVAFTPWGLGIVEAPLWWLGRLYNLPPTGMGAFYVLVRVIPLLSIWSLYGLSLFANRCRIAYYTDRHKQVVDSIYLDSD